jgi:hypothetical protein
VLTDKTAATYFLTGVGRVLLVCLLALPSLAQAQGVCADVFNFAPEVSSGAAKVPKEAVFKASERSSKLVRQAVREVTEISGALLPPRLNLVEAKDKNAAESRLGYIETEADSSVVWDLIKDEEAIFSHRHEVGHLFFGRNMDALSLRWRRLRSHFVIASRLAGMEVVKRRFGEVRPFLQRRMDALAPFSAPLSAARKAEILTRAYDELFADFTAALIDENPSALMQVIAKTKMIRGRGPLGAEYALRRFDREWTDLLATDWAVFLKDPKRRPQAPYAWGRNSRKELWIPSR